MITTVPRIDNELKITPAMVEAGVAALAQLKDNAPEQIAIGCYRAMVAALQREEA